MPELPEVETIRQSLSQFIIGQKIIRVSFSNQARVEHTSKKKILHATNLATILDIHRRGKYLLLLLDTNYYLIIHLGMTGKLVFHVKQFKENKHNHLFLNFASGNVLVFNDARRFGKISLSPVNQIQHHPLIAKLGSEYTENNLYPHLIKVLAQKKSCIKSVLLDQSVIAGIGNIYDSEILFYARIHPNKKANELNKSEIKRLVSAIKKVLNLAIKYGGSSIKDYLDGTGHKGKMQEFLKVYNRDRQLCYNCNAPIQRIIIQGRSTWFCSNCQKL